MANNQYVNKVIFGNETLIDLSSDTVYSNVMLDGYTAHDKSGKLITGTIQYRTPSEPEFSEGVFKIRLPAGFYGGAITLPTINIPIPSSGTNSITIKVPNGSGNDYLPITIEVDSNGNSNITDDTIVATGVSF